MTSTPSNAGIAPREPTIFDLSRPGRRAEAQLPQATAAAVPPALKRRRRPLLPRTPPGPGPSGPR